LVPRLVGDLKDASHQLATYIWERLLDPDKSDADHAEVAFGQLFERRAIDFLRSLHPTRRANEDSIDEFDDHGVEVDALPADEAHEALQEHATPDVIASRRQLFVRVQAKLQEILTTEEYETFVLLNAGDWRVQEIAAALNVSLKTVNNYKNRALAKIAKEFK
jgi:DNA-directed RNA polymerase specialized sigma24 family protein